jgi:hypothetical protein
MQRLSKARIDSMGLRRDLKVSASKRETVDKDTFIELIVGSVESYLDGKAQRALEKTVAKIAVKFPGGKANKDEVDYQAFLAVYAQY